MVRRSQRDPGLGRVHEAVAATFPDWAVLRPSWFMQNFVGDHVQGEAIRTRGEIVSATGDGRVGFIDARDIARVAAAVLTSDVALNRDPILTGPRALSYADVAAILSRSGRPVRHVTVSPERLAEIFESGGMPTQYATTLAAMDAAIATGAEDRVTDEVLALTGTAPRAFEEFVRSQGLIAECSATIPPLRLRHRTADQPADEMSCASSGCVGQALIDSARY